MARPERKTVDYFPFYVEEGQKMFYIEETYGNDGFAVFLKILRELAKVENHYLDLSKPTQLMFLSAKCKVSKEVLEAIIKDLVNLEKFDTELWNECNIIWCQDFIDSIQDAYRKRNNLCMTKQGLSSLLISLGRKKQSKLISKGDGNTQRKEKEIKEEEIIEKFDFKKSCIFYGFKPELVVDWLKVRKNKNLTNTETAFKKFINQVELNGQDKNLILEKCIEKSWGGFESDWFKKETDEIVSRNAPIRLKDLFE